MPPQIADIKWMRRQVTLDFQHQVSTRFRVGAALPFLDMWVRNRQTGILVDKDWGVGDASAYVFWSPWERPEAHPPDPFLSLHNIQLVFGLSLPLGDERKADSPAIHFAQTGSGSIDPRIGVAYFGRVSGQVALFGDANLLIDGGTDTSSFRNGNLYSFRVGGSYAPHRLLAVTLANETVIRWRNYQTGSKLTESGSRWNFLVGRIALHPFRGIVVEAAYAHPLYRYANFVQPVTEYIWSTSVGYRF